MYLSGREKVSYSILAIFTILWAGAFSLLGMDLHHDGVMFKAAADAAAGKAVFREIFSQYGILCPLFQGLILKITGAELAALKLITACFYGGIVVLIDLVWRRFLTRPFRILNLVMFFVLAPYLMVPFHIWSSVYALFFILLAAEFMLLGISRLEKTPGAETGNGKTKLLFFLSGICTAVIFGFRQPCGEVTLLAQLFAAVFLIRVYTLRPVLKDVLLPLFAGSAVILLLYAVYLTAADAWHDYLLQNFKFISKFAYHRGGSGNIANLFETFFPRSESINFIFCIIPLAALVLFFRHSRKFFSAPQELKKELQLLTLLLFGLSSYHQYYPVPCVRHLYWAALPMFGAYALVLQQITLSDLEKYKKVLAFLLLLPVLLWGGGLRMYGGFYRLSEFFQRRSSDLPGLRMIRHGRMELFICHFAAHLNQNLPPELKKRGIFNYTGDGIWGVILPEVPDFKHPMFVNWRQDVYADYPAKAMEYIEKNRPVVLADTPFFHPSYGKVSEFQYMGKTCSLYLPRQ